ncbi:MAG: ATP-binding protein [Myxococcales bacterium]|nr:ATP-binding protein [Myxococcales bacterium]HRC56531.1 ATP-binding protein [Kofleriaceae bacterium]
MSAGLESLAQREYRLQLQAVLLRTMRAALLGRRRPAVEDDAALGRILDDLAAVESELAMLPDDARQRPMLALAQRLGWTQEETSFLWSVVALHVNPRMMVHARGLDDTSPRGISLALHSRIAELESEPACELGLRMMPGHSSVRSGLVLPARGEWVAAAQPWVPAVELVHYLAGMGSMASGLTVVEAPSELLAEGLLDDEQQQAVAQIHSILAMNSPFVLYVEGAELTGRRTAISLATGGPALSIDLAQLSPSVESLDAALSALRREAALRGVVAIIVGVEELVSAEGGRDARMRVLARHLDLADRPVVLITTWRGLDVGCQLPSVRVTWSTPDAETRTRLWRKLAGPSDEPEVEFRQLAHRFALGAGAIRRAVASARVLAGLDSHGLLTVADLQAGVRQNIAERMGGLAERIAIRQSWDELVLSEDILSRVRALVGRVQQAHVVYEQWGYRSKMPRGVGVAALFSGPPGTGKTMVAGLLANELGLELYQVDLSKVVSKWIGETEKQLAKVFDAAEAGHVLLLFDEADALFGQRSTEMRGATDRYANLEVNFLLQRIERFNGIVILTTNLDASIDKALKRRLAAHIVFQHPDEDEQAELWRRLLASKTAPLGRDIDAQALARNFPQMTGANIRNAALAAAFLAAHEGRKSIDHATVLRAARSEYLSMGHVLASPTGL